MIRTLKPTLAKADKDLANSHIVNRYKETIGIIMNKMYILLEVKKVVHFP